MRVGVSQIDITPNIGLELSGFAARIQPSVGVLDPLYARVLCLQQEDERLLWVNLDLLGTEREFVVEFRAWALSELGIPADRIIISAVHTHSAPATTFLQEAGICDPAYIGFLAAQLRKAAITAAAHPEECKVVVAEGRCPLAVDRRAKASAHTDPHAAAIGWRRDDETFAAILMNYPVHAVALGPTNRLISADIPGQAAASLSRALPGQPVTLVTNGACGNLNPPCENVPFAQVQAWGAEVADSVLERLRGASSVPDARLRVASRVVPLPLEMLSPQQIEAFGATALRNGAAMGEWGDRFRRAVGNWQRVMTERVHSGAARPNTEAELFGVRIGSVTLVGVNAEVFSMFTDEVRRRSGTPSVYTVGYANGVVGYLPTQAAYDEGGYEVDTAHLFYMNFRVKPGGLEMLADHAAQLVRELA